MNSSLFEAFRQGVLPWYEQNRRDLPWRNTRDPYAIWLSEIILQQTRVQQGLPYYLAFLSEFSEISELAAAPEDQVFRLWQGLGYYSRARNLHRAAKIIATECGGSFPNTLEGLLKLPGIGPYTAAAIASFAFDIPKAAVDGNVLRWMSRLLALMPPLIYRPHGIGYNLNWMSGSKKFHPTSSIKPRWSLEPCCAAPFQNVCCVPCKSIVYLFFKEPLKQFL